MSPLWIGKVANIGVQIQIYFNREINYLCVSFRINR